MTADLTREQAREQVARALYVAAEQFFTTQIPWDYVGGSDVDAAIQERARQIAWDDADAALSVLWPEVERLTRERDEWREECASAVRIMERLATEACGCVSAPDFTPSRAPQSTRMLPGRAGSSTVARRERDDEIARLTAELAHAHTVIARHVEPKRSTGSWDHKWPGGEACAHCGRPASFEAGNGTLTSPETGGKAVRLCHPNDDGPDCYRLVTVYGERLGTRRKVDT